MSYFIPFSDPRKIPIQVEDYTLNTETSLSYAGKNAVAYGESIAENFLNLLENFSSPHAPENPIEGQVWYDTLNNPKQLRVFNGVEWVPASGIHKTLNRPDDPAEGDMWIDNNTRRLFVYLGSAWVLIGTSTVSSEVSGVMPDTVIGRDNKEYSVLKLNLDNKTIAIISKFDITPKAYMQGFREIHAGFNLNASFFNTTNQIQYTGVSEKSKSLLIGDEEVVSGNFLRSDRPNLVDEQIIIQSDDGITVGSSATMNIGAAGQSGVIKNQIEGSDIRLQIRKDGAFSTVMILGNDNRVGINREVPEYDLDVAGNVRADELFIESYTNSNSADTGSIVTYGGLGVLKDVNVRGFITTESGIHTVHITPLTDESTIGSSDQPFSQIDALRFIGTHEGNVIGNLQGNALTANRLSSITRFEIAGDVESTAPLEFDGEYGGTFKTFNTSIGASIVANRDEIIRFDDNDEILIHSVAGGSSGNDPGLKKITKDNFLKSMPIMPIAAIIPFGGSSSPYGWVLCDGAAYLITRYQLLFDSIGYTYSGPGTQPGYFRVPDLRGRFALGMDNMGGNSANSVSAAQSKSLGGKNGSEKITLTENNLPNHHHDLFSNGKQHYTVTRVGDTERYLEVGGPTVDGAYTNRVRLFTSEVTGDITTNTQAVQDIDTMNPYLALNYIIYTGKI